MSFQTLLDAERSLALTQYEHIAVQGNVTISVVELYKTLGGGWNLSGVSGFSPSPVPPETVDLPP